MSWKKHFTVYQGKEVKSKGRSSGSSGSTSRFQSWLPEVYSGMPNRVERYMQYDQMDMDSEINAALDTIAEFSTQFDEETGIPFNVVYKSEPSESESKILEQALRQWCNLNDWDRRMFKTFRNVIKYGDQPFIRDPETWELMYVNPQDVLKVVVNESEGKKPEQYIMKNLDLNLQNKTATEPLEHNNTFSGGSNAGAFASMEGRSYGATSNSGGSGMEEQEFAVNNEHMMHVAMTEGMDVNWPFGTSILDPIFKTYKQKELLEDAIIIYRVQRAPERRVFYVDVGNMPPHKAMGFVERVKNEIHQRRIPNKTGGGQNVMDAQYNPLSIMEDYFFAQTAEGRGSKVDVLPGGQNLGEIDDLRYFTNKMLRALRVPSSYLPTGPEDGSSTYNDGRVGTAFIQEFRFTKYCQRLQNMIQPTFDKEFKLFLRNRGFQIESSLFDLRFIEPQSFSQYREIEIDNARAGVFNQVDGSEYLSRRFILKKYLGLTEDEILDNESQWLEENPDASGSGAGGEGAGLSSVGVRPDLDSGGDFDLNTDDDPEADADALDTGESPISGDDADTDTGDET
tara:strand:- start:2884 stop:4584 length:1701 start_codon:yes stop_codon:yes gene_type:complete